ncbi:hypothetical protein DAEQUDRAFT_116602 [Daedalea quercina L-15889]|uniref:Uncharacterized protein n=1 Tax=Daedalea quercina L-15889 TaxID=1314783 RepID=A0A165KT52_9APHY|nr:hypothetical protein DAEQUDRAFT_116602 [Daedalea quercina L-15889]
MGAVSLRPGRAATSLSSRTYQRRETQAGRGMLSSDAMHLRDSRLFGGTPVTYGVDVIPYPYVASCSDCMRRNEVLSRVGATLAGVESSAGTDIFVVVDVASLGIVYGSIRCYARFWRCTSVQAQGSFRRLSGYTRISQTCNRRTSRLSNTLLSERG